MSCIGEGKMVWLEYGGAKMRSRWFDLDCDEDWGDIDCGLDENGEAWAGVGNAEDGYEPVTRAIEDTPDGEVVIGLARLRELVEERIEAFSA